MGEQFEDLGDKLKTEWDMAEDKSKDTWDSMVDRLTDGYREASDWSDEKINEAKEYFRGRFGDMNANDEDVMSDDKESEKDM